MIELPLYIIKLLESIYTTAQLRNKMVASLYEEAISNISRIPKNFIEEIKLEEGKEAFIKNASEILSCKNTSYYIGYDVVCATFSSIIEFNQMLEDLKDFVKKYIEDLGVDDSIYDLYWIDNEGHLSLDYFSTGYGDFELLLAKFIDNIEGMLEDVETDEIEDLPF